LAHFAAGARRQDLRDRFMDQALKDAGASGSELRKIVETHAQLGEFDQAARVAESIADGYHKLEAMKRLALEASLAGKPQLAHEWLMKAIDFAPKRDKHYPMGDFQSLSYAALNIRDEKAFRIATERAVKASQEQRRFWDLWTQCAFGAAMFGDKVTLQQMIDRANASLPEAAEAERRAQAELSISAAYACAGDHAAAMRWFEQSKKTFLLADYSVSEEYAQLARGTVLAGASQQAIDDARAIFKDPRDVSFVCDMAAEEETRRGRFPQAWNFAHQMDQHPHRRIALLRHVANHQVAAGQGDALINQVAALTDPRERTLVLLGVAQQMLGIDGMGNTKLFRVTP
jgi:hypothetical protein